MTQELVITLVNDCACTKTGECFCEEDVCMCECECVECEIEYLADESPTEASACGGNCSCSGE